MKKMISFIISFNMIFSFSACGSNSNTTTVHDDASSITIPSDDTTISDDSKEDEYMNKTIELKIDKQVIDVTWLVNSSVTALKELAKDGLTININMHEYGGFEQKGSIDHTLPSADI